MAKNVTILVAGGTKKTVEMDKVSEGLAALNLTGKYTASVNGNPADMDDSLSDFAFVTYSVAVKGNAKNPLVETASTVVNVDDKENIIINGVKLSKAQVRKLTNAGLAKLGYNPVK